VLLINRRQVLWRALPVAAATGEGS
jgi:hypothetical protein